jgi:hypothetical protein
MVRVNLKATWTVLGYALFEQKKVLPVQRLNLSSTLIISYQHVCSRFRLRVYVLQDNPDLLGLLGCLINKEHACREVFSSQHACREVFTTRFSVKCHRKSVAKVPKMVAIILLLPFFCLNVVALVTVAIGECNELRFSCDTQHLYCNTFDAFAILGECCNNSNCNHYGCDNSINCNELGVARNTYSDMMIVVIAT